MVSSIKDRRDYRQTNRTWRARSLADYLNQNTFLKSGLVVKINR